MDQVTPFSYLLIGIVATVSILYRYCNDPSSEMLAIEEKRSKDLAHSIKRKSRALSKIWKKAFLTLVAKNVDLEHYRPMSNFAVAKFVCAYGKLPPSSVAHDAPATVDISLKLGADASDVVADASS